MVSLKPPKPSQLTRSSFWSQVLSWQEDEEPSHENLGTAIEDLKTNIEGLRDEIQGNLDNMPQQLQDADTGQLLQERIEALEEALQTVEGLSDDDLEDLPDDEKQDRSNDIWGEAMDALGGLSCG